MRAGQGVVSSGKLLGEGRVECKCGFAVADANFASLELGQGLVKRRRINCLCDSPVRATLARRVSLVSDSAMISRGAGDHAARSAEVSAW